MIFFWILLYLGVGCFLWGFCWFNLFYSDFTSEKVLGFVVAWPLIVSVWLWQLTKFLGAGWVWCMVNLCDGIVGAVKEVSRSGR